MNSFVAKIIKGKLLLPIFIILFLVHILIFQNTIKGFSSFLLPARGYSKVSIDLQASFVRNKGSKADKLAESGTVAKSSQILGIAKVFDAKEGKIAKSYLGKVLRKIEACKYYPENEQAKGHQGIVKLKLVIKKDGYIKKVEVIKKSRYRELDIAAVESIKNAQPYPVQLDSVEKGIWPVIIDIEYKIK